MIGTVTTMFPHHVFVFIFSFLLPHGKVKKNICLRAKKRRLNSTNHSGKDGEVVSFDRRKREEEYIHSVYFVSK